MKSTLLVLLGFFVVSLAFAQTDDEKQIRITLNNYIEGSSYNQLAQLENAFAKNATLYLKNKENKALKLSPIEYVAFFKGKKKGTFNGRVGKILSIDIENDIATAKAEIVVAKAKTRYIDLFLLRKVEVEGWKIISKTATLSNVVK